MEDEEIKLLKNVPIKRKMIKIKNFVQPSPSTDFAWWLGALAGDGHVAFDRVTLKVIDKDFANNFMKIGEDIFKIKSKLKEYLRQDPLIKRKLQYIIIFYSQRLSQYLGDWSWLNWNKTMENKFSWILGDQDYTSSFLSGYFDAEGSVVCKYYKKQHRFLAKYAAQPEHIKRCLSNMLDKIKIKHSVYSEGIQICGLQNLKRFAALIKSSISRKQERLNAIKNIKVRYEEEYKLAQDLRTQNLKINQISKLLDVPLSTIEGWFYKKHKPHQIIRGQLLNE